MPVKHIKGNPSSQHKKAVIGPSLSKSPLQIPMNTVSGRWTSNREPDHMVVCNMFDQYKLTDSKFSNGVCCIPEKYSSNTFGRNVRTGQWFKLDLVRDDFHTGKHGKGFHRWKKVEITDVPKEYLAAAMLLS